MPEPFYIYCFRTIITNIYNLLRGESNIPYLSHRSHSSLAMAKAFPTSSKECGGQCKVNGRPTHRLCQKFINIRADSLAQRSSTAQTSRLHSSKLRAVSSPASTDANLAAGPRPPCYQEVWIPPSPSQLIKDKRAFLEEHR
jgi:hypothetical protein